MQGEMGHCALGHHVRRYCEGMAARTALASVAVVTVVALSALAIIGMNGHPVALLVLN